MDRIKRFISCYVPIQGCTLRCHYCYITQHRKFNNATVVFRYSPEYIRSALSIKRLGGPCLINFCAGGETLLPPIIVQYVKALLEEGHYVMIVTNATISERFDEIAKFPADLTKRLFFKFSYHYLQLKEKNLLDSFFSNIDKVRKVGCSFTLEGVPSDELIPYIDEMQRESVKHLGAICHLTVARDERRPDELPILTSLSKSDYKKTWSVFHSQLFDFKYSIFGKKRTEFCYAGDWSLLVNIATGDSTQCYCSYFSDNIFKDISQPIQFHPVGNNCSQKHCYNGHAFMVLGIIPEIKTPTYAELRNRVCADGSEWLMPEMKSFMSTRLSETNRQYNWFEKWKANIFIRKMKGDDYSCLSFKPIMRKLLEHLLFGNNHKNNYSE